MGNIKAKPSQDARCQGVWIHPSQNRQSQTLAEQLGADTESDNHYDDTVDFLDDVAASDAPASDDSEVQSSASSDQTQAAKPNTNDGTYYAQADYGYYDSDEYAELPA